MRRISVQTPTAYRKQLEGLGLLEEVESGQPYFSTTAAYVFDPEEADRLAAVAEEAFTLAQRTVGRVLRNGGDELVGFDLRPEMLAAARRSWADRDLPLTTRLDFSFAEDGSPKLMDIEADTPVYLNEAGFLQWEWLQAFAKAKNPSKRGLDQINSIHEALLEAWPRMKLPRHLTFACGGGIERDGSPADTRERYVTEYLAETAAVSGKSVEVISVRSVGWDADQCLFTGADQRATEAMALVYPLTSMEAEFFCDCLPVNRTRLIQPAWTRLLGDKALLESMWLTAPAPFLLPSRRDPSAIEGPTVSKPLRGAFGANVKLPDEAETAGVYAFHPKLYQAYCPLPRFGTPSGPVHAAVSVWMVGDKPAAIGVRETPTPVTEEAYTSVVPHIVCAPDRL